MLQSVTPRTAGVIAILLGVLLAVVGGVLITRPPLSIPGALLLVPATVLVSVGCVWLIRHAWSEPWPPDVRPDLARSLRIRRVLLIVSGVLLPVAIAYGVYSALRGEWWWLAYSVFLTLNATSNLTAYRTVRNKSSGAIKPSSDEQVREDTEGKGANGV